MATGLWSEMGRAFRGPLGWIGRLTFAYILVFFGVLIWAAVGLFHATSTREQILYAVAVLVAFQIAAFCKLYFYMLMNRNALEDRLERIEQQLKASS